MSNKNKPAMTPQLLWEALEGAHYKTVQTTERLGGNRGKELLRFSFSRGDNCLRILVPKTASFGKVPIDVREAAFVKIASRYFELCKRDGIELSGMGRGYTSQFNGPKWKEAPLGRIATPYVAAVVRHIIRDQEGTE